MNEQELAEQESYKAKLRAKRDKLQADARAAVAAENWDKSDAGKYMRDYVNHEVNLLVVDILEKRLPYDDYIEKRAQVATLRDFLSNLDKKAATKETTDSQLKDVNGQLKDIAAIERQQRTSGTEG